MPFGYLGEHGPRSNFNYRRAQKVFRWQAAFVGQLWRKVGKGWRTMDRWVRNRHRRTQTIKIMKCHRKKIPRLLKILTKTTITKDKKFAYCSQQLSASVKVKFTKMFQGRKRESFLSGKLCLIFKDIRPPWHMFVFWYWIYFCQIYMKGHFFRDTHWYFCFILKVWFG